MQTMRFDISQHCRRVVGLSAEHLVSANAGQEDLAAIRTSSPGWPEYQDPANAELRLGKRVTFLLAELTKAPAIVAGEECCWHTGTPPGNILGVLPFLGSRRLLEYTRVQACLPFDLPRFERLLCCTGNRRRIKAATDQDAHWTGAAQASTNSLLEDFLEAFDIF